MNKIGLLFYALISLIILCGCEDSANIRIHNRTGNLVFSHVSNEPTDTIAVGEIHSFEVPTNSGVPLLGNNTKDIVLYIKGETYQIYDDYDERYVDSTRVTVEAGKIFNVYIDSNRAGIKVINSSNQLISNVKIFRHNYISSIQVGTMENINVGSSKYKCVDYAGSNDIWYYLVQVTLLDGTVLMYGDENNVLHKGDLYSVNVLPPYKLHKDKQ